MTRATSSSRSPSSRSREDEPMTQRRRHHRRGASPLRPVRQDRDGDGRRCDSVPHSTDAGVDWKDIQFGFGGSYEVSNPDAVTRLVGLTGITFTNVFNACATAASAIPADRRHDPARQVRHRHRHRLGQASPRCLHRRPGQAGTPPVVRRERPVHQPPRSSSG